MASGEILVKGGFVVDPTRKMDGDVADVAIKDGKIVDKVSSSAKVIDAKGKTVLAGAVDVHAHVAGPKVNVGRLFRPEDKLCAGACRSAMAQEGYRIESGFSIPSTFKTGYDYARMGYAFVMEAAMPPLYSPHIHEEIHDTPIIDEAALPVFGNNWFVMDYIKKGEVENTAAYIAWLLKVTKGYGVKCVNPGGTAAWGWGLNCLTLDDSVPYFEVTPREIITGLLQANEYLGLPHSMHIHQNDLGNPGNYQLTIDSLKLAEKVKTKNKFGREQVMHSTHLQFHSYGGTGWGDFESKAKEVMDYVNKNKAITVDLGCVTLDETTTMTADGPFEHHLHGLNHLKWVNVDVEMETAAGVVPYVYDPNIKVCDIQWAIGLELGLFAKDMNRVFVRYGSSQCRAVHPVPPCYQVADVQEGPRSGARLVQAQRQGHRRHEHPRHRPRTHPLRDRPDDPFRTCKMPWPRKCVWRPCPRHERRCRYLRPQLQEHAL